MKKKQIFVNLVLVLSALCSMAFDDQTGNPDRRKIDMSQTSIPCPHINEVAEPVVMYEANTDMLYIDLDPVYYSEYRVFIGNYLCETELFMTSASDSFSLALAGAEVTVTIESDECGCWEGFVDKVALGGPVGN